MNQYCKRCQADQPHIKAGWAAGKQLSQCKICGTRRTDPSKKNKRPTTTVAVKLDDDYLARLDILPGKNRSIRIRAAIDMATKHKP